MTTLGDEATGKVPVFPPRSTNIAPKPDNRETNVGVFAKRVAAQVIAVAKSDVPEMSLQKQHLRRFTVELQPADKQKGTSAVRADSDAITSVFTVGGKQVSVSISIYDTDEHGDFQFEKLSVMLFPAGLPVPFFGIGDEAVRSPANDLESSGVILFRRGRILVQVSSGSTKLGSRVAQFIDRVIGRALDEEGNSDPVQ
jgi:hypothetical protein